jgi:hypothetical protein
MGASMRGGGGGRWPAWAAAVWAFGFAGLSFAWALGSRLSLGTQARSIREQFDDPEFVAVLWATGGLKAVAGVIALALVLPFGRRVPRRLLMVAAWGTAVLLLLYGGLGWLQALLWQTGVSDIPRSVGPEAARWKLAFWDPFWILGGVLFLLAVVQARRSEQQ